MGRQALLFGKLSSMVVLISVICSLAHGSKGSVAYHPKELPSKLSYIPSFLYRIFLPRTSDAPSGGMSMDHLARAQAPSSLTPHGQTEIGYAKSPSSTMPHALPPIEEEKHKFGFHGKLPRTGTSPPKTLPKGSVSPLPIALPPKSVPPTPAIQGPTAASIPLDAMSPQINIRQEHSRGSSPSDKNQRPQIHPRKGHAASRASLSHSNIHGKRHKKPDAASSVRQKFNHSSPATFSPTAGLSPAITPTPLEAQEPPNNAFSLPIPSPGPPSRKRFHSPGPESSFSSHEHHTKKRAISSASAPTHLFSPPPYYQGPVIPEAPSLPPIVMPRKSRHKQQGPPPLDQGPSLSPTESLFPPTSLEAPAPLPVIIVPSPIEVPVKSPMGPSPVSSPWMPQTPAPSPIRALPPPPPNQDCLSLSCMEPFTYNPPGSPCGCVLPMQVELRLGVTLLTFFPLVSELAKEIAAGVSMKQSQVRIIGANAASQEPDKTEVHLDLVPLGKKMNKTTAFLIYEKFWLKLIVIKTNFFGDYQVLYVHYPGLPPSPPSSLTNITIDDGQLPNLNRPRAVQPIPVNVGKQKERLDGSLIAIIALSSAILLVLLVGAVWLLLWKCTKCCSQPASSLPTLVPPRKPSGAGSVISGSGPSSPYLSFSSSIGTYARSAKTFSLAEIEKATDNFNDSTILGEGGFGRVYRGVLEDGIKVAVKVLKREDHHGSREFFAEVEMLGRLHHRNLVKLIGICTEEHSRCLVYELIPNGSVESHLHGVDKETAPLDWGARLKIALGSARGLAYLHEDSSPRVIHRDFKSSNILLEYDFTPKVSDFGLAKAALDEESEHISTRVMGTFGYVAPEYAMTGHLLVKSDVYSYGVVLLELLTGRKPVDMSLPPGQENLVTLARPLLTSKEGLEMIIDPSLGPDFPIDSITKVAAIASMCVQPEVSHRPFMGEVVQALKLVCNECDEKRAESSSYSQELSAQDTETRISIASGQLQLPETHSFVMANYEPGLEAERVLSTSDIFSMSARLTRHESGSFRRHSSSGPLRTTRHGWFWRRGSSKGSVSEHGTVFKLWRGSVGGRKWPS